MCYKWGDVAEREGDPTMLIYYLFFLTKGAWDKSEGKKRSMIKGLGRNSVESTDWEFDRPIITPCKRGNVYEMLAFQWMFIACFQEDGTE